MAVSTVLILQPVIHCSYPSTQKWPFQPTLSLSSIRTNSTSLGFLLRRQPCLSSPSSQHNSSSSKEDPTEAYRDEPHAEKSVGYPLLGSISGLLARIRFDDVGLEILSIALPAALALAADPISSLVDTAFVGHLGSIELAAVGVSVSVFNLVSKLLNVPLLNVTTSFVAEQEALYSYEGSNMQRPEELMCSKKYLPAVSTSLSLAAGIGILEALALALGSGLLMNIMGIPFDSPMRAPAEQFLTFRAYGAPPLVIALAAQGTFRGFMDTTTPLYAVAIGNLLNVALDVVLLFYLGLGVGGAAIATVVSEYVIAFILLWKLNEKVILIPPNVGVGVARYLTSGILLIARTVAVLMTMTLATSMAAKEGPIPMAGHQICLQVTLAISLLNDALALAGQALLASEYTKANYKQARIVIYRSLQIGAISGVMLALFLFFSFEAFSSVFTNDPAVLNIAHSGIWFVTLSQPINGLAFVFDGLYYGVSDFEYAAYSMVLVGLFSSVFLLIVSPTSGLFGVWTGLFLFMFLRTAAGFWRLGSKSGPWKLIWSEENTKLNQATGE
ncbi:protein DETOXIFICATION 44, chloroplastic-like [Phalaenopsis equestris]|uniref:protein DETOXIFICATION 44, chloroplastic-like n=1 Tax=Phalaenopsis equestris TaxID=78828 RepID=UPI0009E18F5A|nr:protein DETOXIFICATION 44, chloroplastic-like [Phalaenopsis equestris]